MSCFPVALFYYFTLPQLSWNVRKYGTVLYVRSSSRSTVPVHYRNGEVYQYTYTHTYSASPFPVLLYKAYVKYVRSDFVVTVSKKMSPGPAMPDRTYSVSKTISPPPSCPYPSVHNNHVPSNHTHDLHVHNHHVPCQGAAALFSHYFPKAPNSREQQAPLRTATKNKATMFGQNKRQRPEGEHWEDFKKKYATKPGKRRNKSQRPSRIYRLLARYAKWSHPENFPPSMDERLRQYQQNLNQPQSRQQHFGGRRAARGRKVHVVNLWNDEQYPMGW